MAAFGPWGCGTSRSSFPGLGAFRAVLVLLSFASLFFIQPMNNSKCNLGAGSLPSPVPSFSSNGQVLWNPHFTVRRGLGKRGLTLPRGWEEYSHRVWSSLGEEYMFKGGREIIKLPINRNFKLSTAECWGRQSWPLDAQSVHYLMVKTLPIST